MKTSTVRLGSVLLMLGLLLFATLLPAAASASGTSLSSLVATGRLSATEVTALQQAIAEEYLAFNTYTAVLAQYPGSLPFSNIVTSEQQHVSALAGLFTKYGLPLPGNPGLNPTPAWSTLKAACQTGVEVELDDIALYDTLLPVTTKSDLLRVYSNLRSASLNSHLPAFDACN